MTTPTPSDTPRCEQCHEPLPPPGRRGPKRRFHDRCKQRASRARRALPPTTTDPTSPETTS